MARRYGFRGGLVPGVDLYALMCPPIVETWGGRWLERGTASARFLKGVCDGDEVRLEISPARVELWGVEGLSAFLVAGLPELAPEVSLDSYPEGALPSVLPKASPHAFEAASVLGTVETVVEDVLPLYPHLGNLALMANFSLGPWLHVGSEVRHLGLVQAGAAVSVRGRVARWWEHRGHRFVELDLLVVAAERPLALVRHTAIYEPARA